MSSTKPAVQHTPTDEEYQHAVFAAFVLTEQNKALRERRDDLVAAVRRAIPWMGKLIADGAHKNSVLPRDAEIALDMLEAALAKAEGGAS